MEFDSVVEKRKSVRSFKTKKVSFKSVLLAIDSAIQGPYSGDFINLQFLIIENKENIKKIADFAEQTWINEAQAIIVVGSDDRRLEEMYGERGRVYNKQQAGAAIQTILLKLTDLGLASCWVGAFTDELIKQAFKIPAHIQIEALIPVGYEQKVIGPSRSRKTSLENAIFWEVWKEQKRTPLFQEPPRHKDPWN